MTWSIFNKMIIQSLVRSILKYDSLYMGSLYYFLEAVAEEIFLSFLTPGLWTVASHKIKQYVWPNHLLDIILSKNWYYFAKDF